MRNLDMIRIMPVKELAEMFVFYNYICNVWFFNGDPEDKSYDSKEEAVDACINWLNEKWVIEWIK